jgi:hypothetical protein
MDPNGVDPLNLKASRLKLINIFVHEQTPD